jgi:DNA-binding NtrC family response regulator
VEEGGFDGLQRQWERALLLVTLQRTGGNKTKAAQQLKMSIRNFYYKLERHRLIVERIKNRFESDSKMLAKICKHLFAYDEK